MDDWSYYSQERKDKTAGRRDYMRGDFFSKPNATLKDKQGQNQNKVRNETPRDWDRRSRLRNEPNILSLLETVNLHPNAQHPMVSLRPTSGLEHHGAPRNSKLGKTLQPLLLTAPFFVLIRTKPIPPQGTPYDETSHRVLVRGGPPVFEVHARQSMVARVITVERLILVKEVIVSKEAAVQIAIG
jgi:hypothetical protein